MKILQINAVCGSGSTGRIAAGISRALAGSGHDCLVAYGRGGAPGDIGSFKCGGDAGVYLHGALSRITGRHGFYSRAATKRLIRKAEEYRPDVVHLHNLHGYYLHLPALFGWLA
ncbi:MAG: glycosyltransferase, partial [Oscillospiraceae bacterium]|nr:glycosyltransferase [Oscillospiraceae bacterium]